MLRQAFAKPFITPLAHSKQLRCASSGKPRTPPASEAELEAARNWRAGFSLASIDKRPATITTSRSSGPGGQHVNTTDSKVTLKYPLDDLLRQLPEMLHERIRASTYSKKGGFLSIQVSEHRKQAQNENDSWVRLYEEIMRLSSSIPGRTSDAQKSRVEELQKKEKLMRVNMKKHQSSKKESRRANQQRD